MSMILAMSPGLVWMGSALMLLGTLGLVFSATLQREVRRILLTGTLALMAGALPQVAVSGLPGKAWAQETGAGHDRVQQVMLAGMGSQIVYDAD